MLLLLLGLGLGAWWQLRPAADPERGPIVIGLLHPLSGPTARGAAAQLAAARLAVEEINAAGGLIGRQVALQVEDSRSDPRVAAAAAQRLITAERAVALFGCESSSCREAVRPVVEAHQHLLFYPAPDEGMETSAHIVYTGPTPNQQALPATDWALRRFGRRVYIVGTEGPLTRRVRGVLRDFISLQGGVVLGERYLAPGSRDVGGVMADLMRFDPEWVLSLVAGDTNEALFDALASAGQTGLPLVSLAATEPELGAFRAARLDRHFTAWGYLQSLPGPANEGFLNRLRRSQGSDAQASDPAVSTYVALQLWAAAVREVGSVRPDAVNANVLHQSMAAPEGYMAVDEPTRRVWRQLRVAQVTPGGAPPETGLPQRYIRPQPWPTFRSVEHWRAALAREEARP